MRLPHFPLIVAVVLLFCFLPGVAHAGCTTSGNQVTCTGGPGASVSASNPNFGNETTSCGPTTFACPTTVSSPSTIAVSGGSGTVSSLTVTVSGYTGVLNTSANPAVTGSRDMGMLLVSPTGKNLELMRCIGHPSSGGQSNLTIAFQDGATAMPSCAGTTGFTSGGTFEPSAYHSVANLTDENDPNYSSVITGSLNAPQTNETSTFASVFTGDNVNGNWTLYLAADPEEATNISFSSWSITITYVAASTPTTTTLAVTTPSDSHVQTGAAYTSGSDSSITLTATVSGAGTPTGTVLFQDVSNGGSTNLTCTGGNPATLSGGSANCVTTIGTEGYRSLKATYSGDSTFVSSLGNAAVFMQNHSTATGTTYCNSGAVTGDGFSADSSWSPTGSTEHMNPYPSVIFVGDGVNQDITNSVNTVSVTLNNFVVTTSNSDATSLLLVSPSGQALEFWNGIGTSVINGTYTIADGNAQMPVSASGTLASGTYEPTAWFSGTFFTPAPPSPAPQVPSPGLISTPQPLGSSTMLSTFAGATAHGPWSLFLSSGEGSNTTTSLGSWCVNITPATGSGTTTSVVASAGVFQSAPLGGNVTFTATVTSTSTVNAGTVSFTDTYITSGTTTPLGSAPVSNGTASFSTTTLIEGDHLITAAYQGSGSFNDSFGTVRVRVDQTTATPTLSGNTWTYCNTAGITIPARNSPPNDKGAAAPNPSNIFVTNLPGYTESLTLTLNGFHLTNGGSIIESLLVGTVSAAPLVSSYIGLDFFSALSSNEPFGPGNYTFSDLGQSAAVTCAAPFPAVPPTLLAPASCTASTSYVASPSSVLPLPIQHAATAGTSTLNGTFAGPSNYPNGVWSLYFNQTASATNSGASSWCLNFTQAAATVSAAESHVGASFTEGQQGVQLTTVVHNVGQGLTGDPTGTNPLTVTDTLPSGLTYANSFSGSGWSCSATGQTVTCTNDSAVLNTAFYPTLTIDVNVSASAPASVSNTVSVSGAGVTPTTSNTDTITIIPPPSLAATKSHQGTFTQGQTAIWEIFISNVSAGSTTVGTINLADTLPTGYTLNSYFSLGGWTCGASANVVTCASSPTVQGSGSNFNTVRLIVNVPNASPTSVSNTASVWV